MNEQKYFCGHIVHLLNEGLIICLTLIIVLFSLAVKRAGISMMSKCGEENHFQKATDMKTKVEEIENL